MFRVGRPIATHENSSDAICALNEDVNISEVNAVLSLKLRENQIRRKHAQNRRRKYKFHHI